MEDKCFTLLVESDNSRKVVAVLINTCIYVIAVDEELDRDIFLVDVTDYIQRAPAYRKWLNVIDFARSSAGEDKYFRKRNKEAGRALIE